MRECLAAFNNLFTELIVRWEEISEDDFLSDPEAFRPGPDRKPIRWVNLQAHRDRSQIRWPGFREFDTYSFEVGDDGVQADAAASGDRIWVKPHQILAVANMLARGYCDNSFTFDQFSTLLTDQTGLGKTWIWCMLVSILHFYDTKRQKDPKWLAPIMRPHDDRWGFRDPAE